MIQPEQLGEPTASILAFLEGIGIRVATGAVGEDTFLPGIAVVDGAIVYEPARLLHSGDLLHEAGHLAVMPPSRRRAANGRIDATLGDEMMAIGWSYAAAVHANVDPAVVFHQDGYRGASLWFLDEFAHGRYVAVPTLQWAGLTLDPANAADVGCEPYPAMRAWLNDGSVKTD